METCAIPLISADNAPCGKVTLGAKCTRCNRNVCTAHREDGRDGDVCPECMLVVCLLVCTEELRSAAGATGVSLFAMFNAVRSVELKLAAVRAQTWLADTFARKKADDRFCEACDADMIGNEPCAPDCPLDAAREREAAEREAVRS
jgi:hypothetical protein